MKVIIKESKMKDIIKSNFGLDLTDKIRMVTNRWELPFEFDFITPRELNSYLNTFGPMYVLEIGKKLYLTQNQGSNFGWFVVDSNDRMISEYDFMKFLGIEYLGMSMDGLINLYFEE